jgi:hypothetical protein
VVASTSENHPKRRPADLPKASSDMNDKEIEALRQAFYATYSDLVAHGQCADDANILKMLWDDFIGQMQTQFEGPYDVVRLTEPLRTH